MARKHNNLDYVKTTLKYNKSIFNSNNLCIYINTEDLRELKPDLSGVVFNTIPRTEHLELSIFQKGSYDYWRSHLCADFMYCMSEATKIKTSCEYFAWLEDDVLLHPFFDNIWSKRSIPFNWALAGIGATCMIFAKEDLLNIVIPAIKKNYMKDIPLDWNFGHFSPPTPLSDKIGFHIGNVSSRDDNNVTRHNEFEEYNAINKEAIQ
jgi:hypothetical protein